MSIATSSTPLAHVPIFAHLDEAGQRTLVGLMTRREVAAGDIVFWLGDEGDTLFVSTRDRWPSRSPTSRAST